MVADQLYRTVPVCLSHWYYSVGLGGTGRASEYDFALRPQARMVAGYMIFIPSEVPPVPLLRPISMHSMVGMEFVCLEPPSALLLLYFGL